MGKVFWCLICGIGFFLAGVLITNSYSAWQESPISSSITTHPIAELDFPTVTVCPPRGSHTAQRVKLYFLAKRIRLVAIYILLD